MQQDHVLNKLNFDLLTPRDGWRGGGGVCRQNICHHFAALVICLNLICNMVMFWRSWILSFWPQPLSPPRGSDRGLWSKITFDMFHIYYTSWHKFWHLDPQCWQGGGWSLLAKYFLPCCCICDSSLIWYATGPCSQQVEFWPIDPQCWRGGGGVVCWQNIPYHVAAYVIPFNLICNMTIFWRSWILSFWSHHLSPPRGSDRCLWSKTMFDLFHNYFTSVCLRQFSKNVDNWLSYCKI